MPLDINDLSENKRRVLSRAMKKVAIDFNKTEAAVHLGGEDCGHGTTFKMKLYFYDRRPEADREDLMVCNRVIVRSKRELTLKELEYIRASLSASLRDRWGFLISRINMHGYRFEMLQYAGSKSRFKKFSATSPPSKKT